MKKTISILALALTTQVAFGQKYFSRPESSGRVEYIHCHKNQNVIYDRYIKVLDSQIARLVYGLDFEISVQSPSYKIESYKSHLLDLIVKRLFVEELKRQFNINKLNDIYGTGNRSLVHDFHGKVFDLDHIKIDPNTYINNALTRAIQDNKNNTIPHNILQNFKKDLVKELISQFAKSAYKAVGNGLVAKIIAGTVTAELAKSMTRAALMSFGASVIKGAVKGSIISILTAPLYGARKPPETIWREIYSKHPELILNPEWMKEAGSPDHPWMTQCASLQRQTESLEKALYKILVNEETDFMRIMADINEMRDPEEVLREEMFSNSHYIAQRDNTYVKPVIPAYAKAKEAPFWAKK